MLLGGVRLVWLLALALACCGGAAGGHRRSGHRPVPGNHDGAITSSRWPGSGSTRGRQGQAWDGDNAHARLRVLHGYDRDSPGRAAVRDIELPRPGRPGGPHALPASATSSLARQQLGAADGGSSSGGVGDGGNGSEPQQARQLALSSTSSLGAARSGMGRLPLQLQLQLPASLPPAGQFLEFLVCKGYCNQVQAFLDGLAVAFLLKITAVLPRWYTNYDFRDAGTKHGQTVKAQYDSQAAQVRPAPAQAARTWVAIGSSGYMRATRRGKWTTMPCELACRAVDIRPTPCPRYHYAPCVVRRCMHAVLCLQARGHARARCLVCLLACAASQAVPMSYFWDVDYLVEQLRVSWPLALPLSPPAFARARARARARTYKRTHTRMLCTRAHRLHTHMHTRYGCMLRLHAVARSVEHQQL